MMTILCSNLIGMSQKYLKFASPSDEKKERKKSLRSINPNALLEVRIVFYWPIYRRGVQNCPPFDTELEANPKMVSLKILAYCRSQLFLLPQTLFH